MLYRGVSGAAAGLPYHAYSASGDVTAPVVYAGSGNPADYDRLEAQGSTIKGKIALVRYSVPYSYRGFKALTAQQRGAAGLLIYSDPADDGFGKGKVYPEGPWGPAEPHSARRHRLRLPGAGRSADARLGVDARRAPRIDRSQAVSLPAIISAPLSCKDARVILESLGGPEAPPEWRGALPLTYRLGGGPLVVRMRVRADDRVRPIWTVTGMIRGSERPDEIVIVGNHRDAWVYGGVDPSSGSAALMELARTLGALTRGRMAAEALHPVRELGRRGVHADVVDRVGRAARRLAAAECGGLLNVDSAASGPALHRDRRCRRSTA